MKTPTELLHQQAKLRACADARLCAELYLLNLYAERAKHKSTNAETAEICDRILDTIQTVYETNKAIDRLIMEVRMSYLEEQS